jgi:hypothetical protein
MTYTHKLAERQALTNGWYARFDAQVGWITCNRTDQGARPDVPRVLEAWADAGLI